MRHFKYFEDIRVPIKVGDTVLGGRFKNKKTVVKKIGKNKKGDITINGKPLLKYRIIKENFKEDVSYYLSHLSDEGFVVEQSHNYVRIFKPKNGDFYSYNNLQEFNFSEIDSEVIRLVNSVDYDIDNINYMTLASCKVVSSAMDRNVIDINDLGNITDLNMYVLTIMV